MLYRVEDANNAFEGFVVISSVGTLVWLFVMKRMLLIDTKNRN
jgi:hypothetical protein